MDLDAGPAKDVQSGDLLRATRDNPTPPLMSQHSAVLERSRTSPPGGANAPSVTACAPRSLVFGVEQKNGFTGPNNRMIEQEHSDK